MRKGMGAGYSGYFAKTFMASSRDGNYRTKSKRGHADHVHITRDENNQLGLDPCYEQTSQVRNVASPVKLS